MNSYAIHAHTIKQVIKSSFMDSVRFDERSVHLPFHLIDIKLARVCSYSSNLPKHSSK